MRGLAAVSVVAFHTWRYFDAHRVGRPSLFQEFVLDELRLGLYLFFTLSGFLLFRPYARAALTGSPPPRPGAYLRSRLARIAPAYYVCIAITVPLLLAAPGPARSLLPSIDGLWLFAVFAQNYSPNTLMSVNPPTWTLAVELAFYLLLPVIGAFVLSRGADSARRAALAPALLLAAGLAWNAITIGDGSVARIALPGMLPYFAFGMMSAIAVERGAARHTTRKLAAAGAALILANIAIGHGVAGDWAAPILRNTPASAGFALLVTIAARAPRSRILGSRPLTSLGTVSYGLYLWHVPVIIALLGFGWTPRSTILALPTVLATGLILATASWILIERPAIAWARRAAVPRSQRAPAAREGRSPRRRSAATGAHLRPELARGS